jgi:uncharacterized protein (TIGR03067 family)
MRRTLAISLSAIAASLAFALTPGLAHADDPPAKGAKELEGMWKLVSVEVEGTATDPIGGPVKWVIKDNKVLYGGAEIATLTVDSTTSPRIIDLKFKDPEKVYEGIYSVEKSTLKICLNRQADGTKDRPSVLSTKDQSEWRLLVFEQEKDANADVSEGLYGYIGLQLRRDEENKQVVVVVPMKGGPADQAGFKKDDVIVKVGGTAVDDLPGAINLVRKAKPGEKLDFRIRRGKDESTITVKVGVLPFALVVGLG